MLSLVETEDPRAFSNDTYWDNFPYYFNNPQGIAPYKNIKSQ